MSKRASESKKGTKEAGSKRSKGAGSSGASMPTPALPRFIDDEAEEKYDRYMTPSERQKIIPCHYLHPAYIENMGLNCVMEIFGDLSKFMSCDDSISKQLIWEFYANLENPGYGLTTRVNMKNIEITATMINSAFGYQIDDSFINPYHAHSWPEKDFCGLDIEELSLRYFKVIWTKDIETKTAYKPRNLDALPRVVYELMWLLLVPSSGHSSEPTIGQILLFFAIMEGKRINYGSYLRHYITLVANGTTKKDLPCGNMIMRVLKSLKVKCPSSSNLIECIYVKPSFFAHKRVEFDRLRKTWKPIQSKNPRQRSLPDRQGTLGHEAGSSSQMGNVEEMVQKAIQTAVEPLVAQIAQLQLRLDESEARHEARHVALQDRIFDEFDVLRQASLIGMRSSQYNEIINYRAELERARVARHGDGVRNSRREHLRPQQDDDGSSSSRTGSDDRTRGPSQH